MKTQSNSPRKWKLKLRQLRRIVGRAVLCVCILAGSLPPVAVAQEPPPDPTPSGRHVIGMQGRPTEQVKVERVDGLISLVVRDATLSEVLAALAESENLNLVLVASAESRITVSLGRRTLPEALNALLAAGGFTWTIRNDVIYVTSLTGSSVAPEVQGRQLRMYELDYASALDVDIAVKGLLSPVGKSWVNQSSPTDNRRTKEIITVEDLPSYHARIEDYIAQLDVPPRQVLIEVHVLQVDLKDDDRHGVDFSNIASLGGLQLDFHTAGLANTAAPQAFFVQATAPNLTGLIEALKTTTDAKTLASPRIMALNGQESRIQVGEQLGFRVTTTTETSTLESVEFLNVGVVLTVTPHIARDGRVLMRIRPEVSSGSVSPTTGLPEEETTEVQTDVLLASGQGMVIGGLIQENDNLTANKYLGLGDHRFLGPLFQRRQEIKSRSEIIVALVPHVLPLPPNEQMRNDVEFSRARDPLFHGPLCRAPRPYEPRLPDCRLNPQPLRGRDTCEGCDGHGDGIFQLPKNSESTGGGKQFAVNHTVEQPIPRPQIVQPQYQPQLQSPRRESPVYETPRPAPTLEPPTAPSPSDRPPRGAPSQVVPEPQPTLATSMRYPLFQGVSARTTPAPQENLRRLPGVSEPSPQQQPRSIWTNR